MSIRVSNHTCSYFSSYIHKFQWCWASLGILGCWSLKSPKIEISSHHRGTRPASQTSQRSGILLLLGLNLKKAMHSTSTRAFSKIFQKRSIWKYLKYPIHMIPQISTYSTLPRRIHSPVALSLHCLGCYFGRCSASWSPVGKGSHQEASLWRTSLHHKTSGLAARKAKTVALLVQRLCECHFSPYTGLTPLTLSLGSWFVPELSFSSWLFYSGLEFKSRSALRAGSWFVGHIQAGNSPWTDGRNCQALPSQELSSSEPVKQGSSVRTWMLLGDSGQTKSQFKQEHAGTASKCRW